MGMEMEYNTSSYTVLFFEALCSTLYSSFFHPARWSAAMSVVHSAHASGSQTDNRHFHFYAK